jgi:hypothetical protein
VAEVLLRDPERRVRVALVRSDAFSVHPGIAVDLLQAAPAGLDLLEREGALSADPEAFAVLVRTFTGTLADLLEVVEGL